MGRIRESMMIMYYGYSIDFTQCYKKPAFLLLWKAAILIIVLVLYIYTKKQNSLRLICSSQAFNDVKFRQGYFHLLLQTDAPFEIFSFLTPFDLYLQIQWARLSGPVVIFLWRNEVLYLWFKVDVILMHIDDENGAYSGPHYLLAKRVFRNYVVEHMFTSIYFPLGWSDGSLPTARNRKKAFFFAGSIGTNSGRSKLLSLPLNFPVSLNISKKFRSNLVTSINFHREMQSYRWCLIPCGINTETYRLWEAILNGCIPIAERCGIFPYQFKYMVVNNWTKVLMQAMEEYYTPVPLSYYIDPVIDLFLKELV